MHGILDNPVVLDDLAAGFGVAAGSGFDYRAFKERQYDLLAGQVRKGCRFGLYLFNFIFITMIHGHGDDLINRRCK